VSENRELTTKEAAQLAGVSGAYIRRLLINEVLKGRKLNDWLWLVPRVEVERWIEQRKKNE
jgi:excisionase family DNA binding protein